MTERKRFTAVGCGLTLVLSQLLAACNETLSPKSDPIPVPRVRLAGSGSEVCLLDSAGAARCWGQRGVRTLSLPDGRSFRSIAGGVDHLCGISTDSVAYCWGRSNNGQLGTGKTSGGMFPERVATNVKFVAIAPASYATCALDAQGLMYCWGNNVAGGLANGRWGTEETVLYPTRAKSSVQFRAIGSNCASSLDYRTYCWYSTKGSGSVDPTHTEPGNCGSYFWTEFIGNPCAVPTPIDSDIRSSNPQGCLLDQQGAAYCYGDGIYGELGNGTSGPTAFALRPVAVSGSIRFAIQTGRCGVSLDGQGYCWGDNRYDQLGIGVSGGFRTVPTRVATDERFVELMTNLNSCGLTTTDEVWCWGINEYGINGPTAVGGRSNVPIKVVLPP